MNELALFAGAGGGILGGKLLGWRTVCAVEVDAYCASVLVARQNDGILEPFPVWDDVRTFDGRPWRGVVDVVSGGFPCQDISCAGKGTGIDGERSGLWREFARIVGEVRPRYVFVENSPILTIRGFGRVLGDMAAMGYDARWGVLGADDIGAPHGRARLWIMADAVGCGRKQRRAESKGRERRSAAIGRGASPGNSLHAERWPDEQTGGHSQQREEGEREESAGELREPSESVGHAHSKRSQRLWELLERSRQRTPWEDGEAMVGHDGTIRIIKPGLSPVANGVARRVERLRATGNGQVPAVAALAWRILSR
jgi:DNA (cytosine-5)-methyltransferase 1